MVPKNRSFESCDFSGLDRPKLESGRPLQNWRMEEPLKRTISKGEMIVFLTYSLSQWTKFTHWLTEPKSLGDMLGLSGQ